MLDRTSPLSQSRPNAGLSHRAYAMLLQYHAWPERYAEMARTLAGHCGVPEAPKPGRAARGATAALLRVHPQRLWLVAEKANASYHPQLDAETGATLDLSHARTIIHVSQDTAVLLLSRFVATDVRPDHFAIDQIALTPIHRVGVALWRRADGFDILVPRSFARSIWEVLAEAAQPEG